MTESAPFAPSPHCLFTSKYAAGSATSRRGRASCTAAVKSQQNIYYSEDGQWWVVRLCHSS